MPSRPDRLTASSDPDNRPEPSLSGSGGGRAGLHALGGREGSPRAAILAGPSPDDAAGRLELRAGERMTVVSSGDGGAESRGLMVKAAGGAILLLAIFGAFTLLHGFAGL